MERRRSFLLGSAALILSGCGISESRFNPLNWFGGGEEESDTLEAFEIVEVADARPLVARITSLSIDRTPGGAIIRVTGLPPTQGWYDVSLVDETGGEPLDGVLSYSLRAFPPQTPTRVSTPQSRELTAARFISDIALAQVRVIQVTGSENSRAARR